MVTVRVQACPRCGGAILDYAHPPEESALCITCGWRDQQVPESVQDEVRAHLGKSFIDHVYTHRDAGRGKPPLSGWEREKRRRVRESLAEQELNSA